MLNYVTCATREKKNHEASGLFYFGGEGLMWRPDSPIAWRTKKYILNDLWCDMNKVEHHLNIFVIKM